jgi:hypothetical protein
MSEWAKFNSSRNCGSSFTFRAARNNVAKGLRSKHSAAEPQPKMN